MTEENKEIETDKEKTRGKCRIFALPLIFACIVIVFSMLYFLYASNNVNSNGYFEILENSYGREAVPLNEKEIFLASKLVNEGKKMNFHCLLKSTI